MTLLSSNMEIKYFLTKSQDRISNGLSLITVNCTAFSDKFSCLLPASERFICHGHPGGTRCINPEYVCDGKNDCWDSGIGYDEEKCSSKGAFQIILLKQNM